MNDSIGNIGKWEQVGEVIVPQQQESLVPVGMKVEKTQKPVVQKVWQINVPAIDSVAKAREDSITWAVNDSLAHIQNGYGMVLEDPYYVKDTGSFHVSNGSSAFSGGMSWIFALLGILFCLICFKSRNNSKYFRQLWRDLRETRIRHNMFDNTVRESSFMVILNVLWIVCAGILLWEGVDIYYIEKLRMAPPVGELMGVGVCIGVAAVYLGLVQLAYWITGNVFSDAKTTKEWLRGANSATALEAIALFPPALVALCYPESSLTVVEIGAILFGIGKLLFIYKGFRIFFSQIASLLLFLYYFCSLEIIPLILAFVGAVNLIGVL